MTNILTSPLNLQGNALLLRSERQRLIASNIANAETPGYKSRDFDFAQALQQAGTGQNSTLAAAQATARAGDIPLKPTAGDPSAPGYSVQTEPTLDNNSVDMDRERAAFTDNAVRYEATLRFINYQVRTLQSAITGQ